MNKKKQCRNEIDGLLSNRVTIQWKLYCDRVVKGRAVGLLGERVTIHSVVS